MIIEKKYKPSFHKANARYRGVTEHSQYTNFVLESAHDLMLLSTVTTGNEAIDKTGHNQSVYDNFASIMTGDKEVGKSNIFTASTLQKIDHSKTITVPELTSWSKVNGCTVAKTGDTYKLTSNGLLDPVGIYSTLYVEPGDNIYIRLKARSTAGAPDFSFGSNNMRKGPTVTGDVRKVPLAASSEFVTYDYVLRSQYAQAISISLNVHKEPAILAAGNVEIKDFEIYYIEESPIQVSSYHTGIKPNLDELEEKINSIR